MKKKLLAMIGSVCLILVLAALLLPACAKEVAPPTGEEAQLKAKIAELEKKLAEAEAAAPTPTPAAKVWKLKLQSNWTGIGTESQDISAQLFCDRVKTMSGGRIEMVNYDAEVLLGMAETHVGVADGVADVAVTSPISFRGIVPVGYYLWAVPFFPNDHLEFMELVYQFMGVKEVWREAWAEQGIMGLTYECSDEWGTMVSTKRLTKFSDYKGLKVRAFGIWADWLVHNGASITQVPGGEIYMAISTGVLDAAAFGSPNNWAGAKLYEVCDYFINPSIIPYDTCEVIMNLETFNEMPADLQEIMLSSARVHNLDVSALTIQTDAEGRRELAASGMETIFMADDELLKAKEWCWNTFLEARGEDPYIDRLIDIYIEARALHEEYFGPKRLP